MFSVDVNILTIPDRMPFISPIVRELGDPNIFLDREERGPWFNARRAWESGLRTESSHILVLHDDIELSKHFLENVYRAIEAMPKEILSFFCSKGEALKAKALGFDWVSFKGYAWGAAVCMPRKTAEEFLSYNESFLDPAWRADDTRISVFCCATNRLLYCTAPSLVQHAAGIKSSIHGRLNDNFQASWFDPNREPERWGTEVLAGAMANPEEFLLTRKRFFL